MRLLIRDVLTYSELASVGDAFENVDLYIILQQILSDFELLIEQKQAQVSIGPLPTLVAIPSQMQQLFGNLLSNALKYAKENEPPRIEISATRQDDYWHIQVSDSGIGFPMSHATQIFNIFQRLHNKKAYSGTGIGLAICQKIVENHGGSIHAVSETNQGATFHILLPANSEIPITLLNP